MLTVSTITHIDDIDGLVSEWEKLEAGLSPRFPFTSPLWTQLWWKHYRRSRFSAADELRIYVVRDDAGALVGVAPMFLSRRPGRGVLCTRELQFIGADNYVTELRGPICSPCMTGAVVTALRDQFERDGGYDWVQWRGLQLGEDFAWTGDYWPDERLGGVDYFFNLPASWETFRSGLSRNIKESLRKCYNSLAREKRPFELKVVRAPEETDAALDKFLELHRARSERTDTIYHGDVFSSPEAEGFLFDYCRAMAARNQLLVFQLWIDGKIVATRIAFGFGDEIYLYFSGYDADYGRFSVMTTTVAEAIKWSIENGFRILNLSTGSDVSKTRWRPEMTPYSGGYLVSSKMTSRVAFHLVDFLRNKKLRSRSPASRDHLDVSETTAHSGAEYGSN